MNTGRLGADESQLLKEIERLTLQGEIRIIEGPSELMRVIKHGVPCLESRPKITIEIVRPYVTEGK
jgi:hypothetical protein